MLRRAHFSHRVALAWLSVCAGGLIAGASLWHEGRGALPAGAVARVGDQAIARERWLRAVAAVEGDRGAPLDETARRTILQRLIDEELLYQHALDSGLARDDPGLRKTLVAGLIDAVTAGSAPDEAAARALFEQDPGYFAAQPRLRVRALSLSAVEPPPPLAGLRAALLGGAVPPGAQRIDLPDAPVPLPQLALRLGGGAAEALRSATLNEPVGPLALGLQQLYLLVLAREAEAPRYEDVAEAVRSEWARREAEAGLERLLEQLRKRADIRVADDAG